MNGQMLHESNMPFGQKSRQAWVALHTPNQLALKGRDGRTSWDEAMMRKVAGIKPSGVGSERKTA